MDGIRRRNGSKRRRQIIATGMPMHRLMTRPVVCESASADSLSKISSSAALDMTRAESGGRVLVVVVVVVGREGRGGGDGNGGDEVEEV